MDANEREFLLKEEAFQIVADTKVIEQIGDHELGQMLNYLKITGLKVGLILNFKQAKLEWKRVILEENRE